MLPQGFWFAVNTAVVRGVGITDPAKLTFTVVAPAEATVKLPL